MRVFNSYYEKMLKVKDDWLKMAQIRWAYESGVQEAVLNMLKVKDAMRLNTTVL